MFTIAAGLLMVLLGEGIRLWGVAIAGSETRTTGPVGGTYLITKGPFAYVRNPLYVGNMLMYVGVGIMSNALFPWLVLVAFGYFLFQYSMIVSIEEEYLSRTFTTLYDEYRSAVPRFVPNFSRFAGGSHHQPVLDWRRGLLSERRTLQAIGLLTLLLLVTWYIRE